MESSFTQRAVEILRRIPEGQVTSYGIVAGLAGNPRGARQVVRILHSLSRKYNLPWHRVINSKGYIAIKDPEGFEEQKILLEMEGIISDERGKVKIDGYWTGNEDKISH